MKSSSMIATVGDNSRRYENDLRNAQRELSNAHEHNLRLQHNIGSAFQKMASYQLADGADVSREVQRLLDLRTQSEADLRRRLSVAELGIGQHMDVESGLCTEIAAAIAGVNRELQDDPEYKSQAALLGEAVAVSAHAAVSYAELREECQTKLQAFQGDRLFLYLKGSEYGTDGYRRGTVLRAIDRRIARLCNFTHNLATEKTLLAMQEANEGANSMREANRAAQQAELSRFHDAALVVAGVPQLEDRLEQVRQALGAAKADANGLHQQLDSYAGKADQFFIKASALLAAQLADMSMESLMRHARSTSTPHDDELVDQVRSLRSELDALQSRLPLMERDCKQAERNYERAKHLERDLRSSHYTSDNYRYSDGMDLDSMLVGYMAGSLSHSQVVSEVDSNRRSIPVESTPTFGGSGGSDTGGFFNTSSSDGGGGFSTSDSL